MKDFLKSLGLSENVEASLFLFAHQLILACCVLLSFWLLSKLLLRLIRRLSLHQPQRHDIFLIVSQITKFSLLIVGVITALGTLGVDVSALIAGLGLTGFALGFALKDILSNAIAGMMILFYSPFQKGDNIEIVGGPINGKIWHVDLRYTTVLQEGKMYLVPNGNILTNTISVSKNKGHDEYE